MLRYIGRRLLQTIPVFFGATFLIFAMVYLMPGDPVAALGGDRGLSEAAAAQIRAQYNLDKPFWMQYLLYLKGVFTLDFGTAFNGQKVTSIMRPPSRRPRSSPSTPSPSRPSWASAWASSRACAAASGLTPPSSWSPSC